MSRLIQAEATAILAVVLRGEAEFVTVAGVDVTPDGPRVRFAQVPRPRPRDPKAAPADPAVLCELLSRTLALRWRTPSPVAPEDSYVALTKAYPTVYTTTTETSAGWHWLLAATAEKLIEHGLPAGFQTLQVKEKFATLRFYWGADDDARPGFGAIIEAAERLSAGICDACGRPGRFRSGGWSKTACDEHAR
ncbi:hypothetical protein [Methylobacterium sp. WL12]|uniref:hypothetical protein n=1 Tax=Methylobacterium sp. WL12 TaxID=2603890 RepID=UPI001AEE7569|nr:hypothetical protein [Methylobacterium sp. WL12]